MRGLRVDTFKIFNNRRDHRQGCRPSFKHNPGRAAPPAMENEGETKRFQRVIKACIPANPLPPLAGCGYPRCRADPSVTRRASPNLKQVTPYGGH